jgi:hypothetical protein
MSYNFSLLLLYIIYFFLIIPFGGYQELALLAIMVSLYKYFQNAYKFNNYI